MANYVMEVFDYRISEECAVSRRTYSSINDLVRNVKRTANKYITDIAVAYEVKPDVCCYYIGVNKDTAVIDIYDDECVIACIEVVGI